MNTSLQKEILLKGKVVEISFSGGKQIMKLFIKADYMELIVDTSLDIHLDDEIYLNGNIMIEQIIQDIPNELIN